MKLLVKHLLTLTTLFTLSRVVIYPLRPFYYAPINFYMQYLDPEILRSNLFHGLWHLHSQPPLFNLFLGGVLKVSPAGLEPRIFAVLYFGFSLGTVLLLHAILRRLGVRGWLTVAAALLYALLPSTIRAERWLFYACPAAFLLTASVYALMRFAAEGRTRWYALFAGLCATIVLTRSFYHLVFWMLPVLVGGLWVGWWRQTRGELNRRAPRTQRLSPEGACRTVPPGTPLPATAWRSLRPSVQSFIACSGIAVVALLIASYPYILNAARYGMFTASTWQGMSIAKMTRYVSAEDIEAMIAKGQVTPLARIPCFADPAVYREYYGAVHPTGVAVLDDLRKSNGEPNWNNVILIRASREYQRNSVAMILRHPWAYAKAVLNEVYLFFGLRSHVYLEELRAWIVGEHFITPAVFRDGLILFAAPVLYLFLFAGALVGFGRRLRSAWPGSVGPDSDRDQADDMPSPAVFAYALFLILYTFGLACLAELGEGGYMRMPVEPLMVAGCGVWLQGRRWRRFRQDDL